MSRVLTLICPGMALPLAQAMALQASPDEVRRLSLLAGRGEVSERSIDRQVPLAQSALLEALGLTAQAAAFSGAAVMRAASVDLPVRGFWMRLEPVHLVAGLDRINVSTLPHDAWMSQDERDQLHPLIQEYLVDAGLCLHAGGPGQWLVSSERELDVHCVTPEYAASHPNAQVLPAGDDAGALRRLMTELQMLLHDHPVNQQRQRRGLPVINSLWLHGEGSLGEVAAHRLLPAFGDDAYLQGIYRLHDMQLQPVTDAVTLLSQLQGDALAVLDVTQMQVLEDAWLEPVSNALRRGRITGLHLVLGRWQVRAGRSAMFKFWRRAQVPAQWAVRN